jgi:glycosyltransferase involved in cell wall biosynthesis
VRIALITSYDGGGTWNIAKPLADTLRYLGHTVTLQATHKGETRAGLSDSLEEFDVVHFFNIREALTFAPEIPSVITIHHIPKIHETSYLTSLRSLTPSRIHTVDKWTARQLGREGFYNVAYIPQAFDHSKWPRMPLPTQFAVGYLGDPEAFKRFEIIELAAKQARVPCYGVLSDKWHPQSDILALYQRISCYVVASFEDGGPLPAQEAMLCGRPVATTYVGMMPDVMWPGRGGEFHDGSIDGCAAAIKKIQLSLASYDPVGCATDFLPSVDEVALEYEALYRGLLEG